MRTTQSGMLTIDERIVFLAVLLGVSECYFDIIAAQVAYRIQGIVIHAVVQQIAQSVTRQNTATVEHYGKTRIQIRIVSQHRLDKLASELVVLEQCGIRLKEYVCTVLVLCRLGHIILEYSFLERGTPYLTVTIRVSLEA